MAPDHNQEAPLVRGLCILKLLREDFLTERVVERLVSRTLLLALLMQ